MKSLAIKIISIIMLLIGIFLYAFKLGKKDQKAAYNEEILDEIDEHKRIENLVDSASIDALRKRMLDNYSKK